MGLGLLASLGTLIYGAKTAAQQGLVTQAWANGVSAVFTLALVAIVALTQVGVFEYRIGEFLSPLFAAYVSLVGAASLWAWRSEEVGRALRAIPLHHLIGIQSLRVLGGVLVVEYFRGHVPTYFAMTVGWGDVIAGLTAPITAWVVMRRSNGWKTIALVWTTYAIGDLCHSAVAATLSARGPTQLLPDIATILGSMPVSPLVTFLVPVAFVWCIATFRSIGQQLA